MLTVGAAGAAAVQLALRRAASEAMDEPYRRGLRLMGLSTLEINSVYLVPQMLTGLCRSLGDIMLALFAAAAVAEWVFGWPGAAVLFLKSVALHDWNVAALVLLVFAAFKFAADFAGDSAPCACGERCRAMSAIAAAPARSSAPRLRAVIRGTGIAGLALIAVTVGLSDVIARAPADSTGIGPMLAAPSSDFILGTDVLGRDVLSETLHALAVTLIHAGYATAIVLAAGGFAGFVAARFPWRSGFVLRWIAGILSAVPALLLAILFIGITDRSFAAEAAGLAAAPLAFVRTFDRARVLAVSRHAEFARATGIQGGTLMRRDLAYEFRDTFLTIAARALAAVTITLSTVSFLGFGAVPPHRDLGLMIAAARATYLDAWWTAAFPALALLLLILFARLAAVLDEGERP